MFVKCLLIGCINLSCTLSERFFTHTNNSRGNKAFSSIFDSVYVSVCCVIVLHSKARFPLPKLTARVDG